MGKVPQSSNNYYPSRAIILLNIQLKHFPFLVLHIFPFGVWWREFINKSHKSWLFETTVLRALQPPCPIICVTTSHAISCALCHQRIYRFSKATCHYLHTFQFQKTKPSTLRRPNQKSWQKKKTGVHWKYCVRYKKKITYTCSYPQILKGASMRYDIFDGATPEFVLVFVFAFVSVFAVPASVLYFCCCLGKSIFVSVCLGFRCTQKNQGL